MPNETQKDYPRKDQGAVLVCSKVMREGYTRATAVSRIFAMHGNAVIRLETATKPFVFTLTDALGNDWVRTSDITQLARTLVSFHRWSSSTIRQATVGLDPVDPLSPPQPDAFIEALMRCNAALASKLQTELGGRYFGNISTRCQELFPGSNLTHVLVSPRNSDKRRLTASDMTHVFQDGDRICYHGSRKPSVDAPVQLKLFQSRPGIRFFIHGHAYVEGAPVTQHYFPCGDLREVPGILELMHPSNRGIMNLRRHGFLIYADGITGLRELTSSVRFAPPNDETPVEYDGDWAV